MPYYLLPTANDADRVFRCALGDTVYSFRTYYIQGCDDFWFIDFFDLQMTPLFLGRKVVNGSTSMLKGCANVLSQVALTCGVVQGSVGGSDAFPDDVQLLWNTSADDALFTDGDPMDTLGERFAILSKGGF